MKKSEIEIGGRYTAKVSGKLATVEIYAVSPFGGWLATNVETGHRVRIRTAGRLRSANGAASRLANPATTEAPFARCNQPPPSPRSHRRGKVHR